MTERFDVVVVGAGPAGSTAAREAAAHGGSVLLLEKGRRVGEPVRCGEFLPARSEMDRICADPEGLDELFDLPTDVRARFIPRARAVAPSGATYEVPFEGHSIHRDRLDAHLARMAEAEGAELRTETPFLGVEDGRLVTGEGRVEAGAVVGADGPRSTVARTWGFPVHELLFPALSLPVPGSFDPVFEAYFGGAAPGGYAWVIPRAGDANVGLGVRPDLKEGPLHRALDRFLEARGLRRTEDPTGGFVPMSGPLPTTVRPPVVLAGDAAGHVLSTSGGGIFTAMICGRLAGRAAVRYARGEGRLEQYEKEWRRVLGGAFERGWRLFQTLAPAFDDPEALEEAFRLLGPEGLLAALRCQELAPDPARRARPRAAYPRRTRRSP